jgi:uncharacterized membrane protein
MDAVLQTRDHRPQFDVGPGSMSVFDVQASRLYRWVLLLLCSAAFCLTGYLAFAALMSGEVAGCGEDQIWNCGHVLNSRWSKIFGLPVSVPAFVLYGAMLISLATGRPTAKRSLRRLAWGAVTIGALAAGTVALWFIGLQTMAIGRLCIYCLLAHACGIALCAAILWKRPLGTRVTAKLSVVSLLSVAFLVGGQVLATPPATYKIERFADNASPEQSVAEPAAAESKAPEKQDAVEVFEPF